MIVGDNKQSGAPAEMAREANISRFRAISTNEASGPKRRSALEEIQVRGVGEESVAGPACHFTEKPNLYQL